MRKSCDSATSGTSYTPPTMELRDVQARMRDTYGERDAARGVDATFRWLTEEVGELAKAMRSGDPAELAHECSDVLAWLASLAEQLGVDLESAMARFADGCPKCGASPCRCDR
jgi:NTP pyrophosphatase (non-canonical NTP hydrolase)